MNDDQHYYDLARARSQQKEVADIKSEAERVIRPPSGTLYAFLYGLAILGDLIDLTVFTGIGAIISFLLDLIIGAILFFAGRGARDRMEAMNKFQDELHNHIESIEKKVVAYRNAYARVLRTSRKVKALRKPVRQIALRLSRLRKSITRGPLGRTVAAIIADLIPIIDLLPWRTINIYMMKRDELQAFQDAQNMLPEYMGAKADELEAANDLREAEMLEQAA